MLFRVGFWYPGFLQIMLSSHTRESVTDKASCSIGYGAKKTMEDTKLSTLSTGRWFCDYFVGNFLFATFFNFPIRIN